jgi:hypothetical protein
MRVSAWDNAYWRAYEWVSNTHHPASNRVHLFSKAYADANIGNSFPLALESYYHRWEKGGAEHRGLADRGE